MSDKKPMGQNPGDPGYNYELLRSVHYLPLGEQIDAILKFFVEIRDKGTSLPPDLEHIISHWQNVKAEFPKQDDSGARGKS